MTITGRQIQTVQASWEGVVPIADAAVGMFYDRLFQLDPELRERFQPDLKEQRKRFAETFTASVRGLGNLDAFIPAIQALGARHAAYGVKDEDYANFASALLWTLRQCLGPAFDKDVSEAWIAAFDLIASTMRDAAHEAAAKSA
jgi:hemoglobin-like flavoprotein